MSTPSIFAQLPGELLCDIFEHAAAQCPSNALALSLVSSWVHALVEPLLYHTVVLPSSRSLRAFLATLATKHPSFPTHRVKNLGVFAIGPAHSIVDVVQRCRGAQSIACAFNVPACKGTPVSPADVARMHAWSRTQEQHLLGMACKDGWDARVVGEGVTRLRVHLPASGMATMFPDPLRLQQLAMRVAEEEEDNVGWAPLAQLPNLTHLAIVYRPSER
ncbi:hypothetical protein EUX98_g3410 [Antrodiella citrinella]|uniref:Uncharacterized protein n=1 Tax=Antrodiella citrinella TaxID=2447956 RepID=A0A4S4MXR3_9APHY|nr:hypothetical protein EUX98_g3410 [Antrodiella citrinella]